MKTNCISCILFSFFLCPFICFGQTVIPAFTAPDTVCVNAPVTITNTSIGASSYYWNFCVADVNTPPQGVNLGNVGNTFSGPVFFDYVFDGINYYGFQTNNWSGNLVRLDFGNSLLNIPIATTLSLTGGTIPKETEGIQVVFNEGKWYAIIVGGDPATFGSSIAKVEFGTNIANNNPLVTNWGNLGNLNYPHDLYLFQDSGNWYGFTVNARNNTITRFNFTSSFSNTPVATNLGNLINLDYPTGICAIKENNSWYAFVTSATNSTLTRLNFGTSLLNIPTAQNLGNINGMFKKCWDIQILKYCQQNIGFVINAETGELLRLDFGNSITNTPTVSSYGNIGNLSFPHCLSRMFRVGADLYTFISNVNNGTLSRVKFTGCTNSSIPNSTNQTPPPVTYNAPGVYNINLTIDDGLPTQASLCKQIVVVAPPTSVTLDVSVCPGNSINLNPTITGATAFSWSPATGLSDPTIQNPIASPNATTQYILKASNAPSCSSNSAITVKVLTPQECATVIPTFNAPDTVCVNNPVNITNTTTGASSYYWNFCVADLNTTPTGVNLGNPGNYLSEPVFCDIEEDNGNYYGFVVNHVPGGITRLDFGNSLLNTPTPVFLGNISGVMNTGYGSEGIQIVKNNGQWYGILVGGSPASGSTPKLITIYFGANLNNPTPNATNWGNVGNMLQPIDLHVFQENGNWYGLTVNAESNTITRFSFTNDFNNPPSGVNLGNIGNLSYPTGVFALNDGGNWYVFVTNQNSNSITRLDFGNSLLNNPNGVSLGNPNNALSQPRDITILKYCGQMLGFVDNAPGSVARLNFSSVTSNPTATNLGNLGNLSFPHSLSKLFRVGNDLYSLITNVNNNTITRLRFAGCTNSSIPNSSLQTPPPVIYNSPGTYNITLTVDDGLPTQNSICKQVVVIAPPAQSPTQHFAICYGDSIKIGSAVKSASYQWSTGSTTDSIFVNTDGIYWVESANRYGCVVRDSFIVAYNTNFPPLDFGFKQDICSPKTVQFTSALNNVVLWNWDFGDGNTSGPSKSPINVYNNYGVYTVKLFVRYPLGCRDSIIKTIKLENVFDNNLLPASDTTICLGDSILLKTTNTISDYCWQAPNGAAPTLANAYIKPTVPTTYILTSEALGPNLVINGDFSNGNTGFKTNYNYTISNFKEGEFSIVTSPHSWNQWMSYCGDHTSGNGNMLLLNGSPVLGDTVWSQTVTVVPNTIYRLSAWLTNTSIVNPAHLRFAIGAGLIHNFSTADTCQWTNFSTNWNSGAATSATITIYDIDTVKGGNDFALDDIFFGQVTIKTDSINVNVVGLCDSVKITGANKICSPSDTVTYSIYKSPNCTQLYSLQVDNTYADIISQTPVSLKLLFKKNGTTTIKVAYANNCKIVVDSLDVAIKFSPASINFGPDVITCRDTSLALNAGDGFISYTWQDGSKDSTFTTNTPGSYNVIAQNLCGVQLKDTLKFIKSYVTPFTVSPLTAAVCKGDSVQFKASGGSSYAWYPPSNFSSPSTASPKALIDITQDFSVHISDPICLRDTTFIIPVVASPGANITVSKSNDVNCSNDSAFLVASGGVSYTWSPNLYISRNNGNRITVKPYQNTTYTVRGKDELGCFGQDSITVYFVKEGAQKLFMPNAFTPNGDGVNDVFRPTFIGPSANYDFCIYNRWGQLVFRSKVPGVGWDGTVNGVIQKTDVYVFYITAEGVCNGKFVQKGTFALIR